MVGYHGFDGVKVLLVNDLDLAKQVFVKDFDHFVDRRKQDFGNVYFENMMFFAEGEAWDARYSMLFYNVMRSHSLRETPKSDLRMHTRMVLDAMNSPKTPLNGIW